MAQVGVFFSIKVLLNFFPNGPIGVNSTLVQKMAGHKTDDKPLPEPMKTHELKSEN